MKLFYLKTADLPGNRLSKGEKTGSRTKKSWATPKNPQQAQLLRAIVFNFIVLSG
ncbi:hypothetical protein [Vagococcus acidifermentans]|uniref:hypothetical protein n=1 Tax=Vagococcus acidifermentans TaxID=564710 RepID=UPI0014774E03|nr:hypothetical protein [Vagococcus acidifermentans]